MTRPTTASNWVTLTASSAEELDLGVEGVGAVDEVRSQLLSVAVSPVKNQTGVGTLVLCRQENMRRRQGAAVQPLWQTSIVAVFMCLRVRRSPKPHLLRRQRAG